MRLRQRGELPYHGDYQLFEQCVAGLARRAELDGFRRLLVAVRDAVEFGVVDHCVRSAAAGVLNLRRPARIVQG